MHLSSETASASSLPPAIKINPEAVLERDGCCRQCGDPTESCANCFGSKKKRRDGRMCRACNGWGVKAFCRDPDCRKNYYAARKAAKKRPRLATVTPLHPPQPIAAAGVA